MKALVLAAGVPQIKLIKTLKSRGYEVILADYNENPVAKEYADVFFRESTLDVDAIRRLAVDEKVDLIITCCTDQAVQTMSKLSEELKLPCYVNGDIGIWVTNKAYMKDIFKKNDIPTANYIVVSSEEIKCDLKYPLIVKPADCNSSKGVEKVNNEIELKKALRKALEYSRTKKAIVEEFVKGTELSIDLFVNNGKAEVLCISSSDKIKDSSKFVIWRGCYPANISKAVEEKIKEISQKIVDAFGLKNSPMLIQMLVNDDGIYVVEFSARTGGCIKYHMIELASGVDVIKNLVDVVEGKEITINTNMSNKTIVNEFIYCNDGVFEELVGFDECIKEDLLEDFFLLKNKGTYVGGVNSSGDRIAALTYVAESYEDYIEKHNQVLEKVKVIDKEGKNVIKKELFSKL